MAKAVTVKAVHKHLEAFQKIADANGGNRGAGTSGYNASGDYVEQVLQKAGYETERQWFDFVYDEVVSTSLDEVSPEQRAVDHYPMSYSPSTPVGGVTRPWPPPPARRPAARPRTGPASPPAASPSSAAACAPSRSRRKRRGSRRIGVVVYNNTDVPSTARSAAPATTIPVTGVTQADGQGWLAKMADGPVT